MGLGLALELHVTLIQPAVLVDVFSPSLSCSWALPGNMKKRLLMPSRGKAWGGRWRGAVAESCRDACVYCLLADWAVQGTYRGSPHRPRPQPILPCSCRLPALGRGPMNPGSLAMACLGLSHGWTVLARGPWCPHCYRAVTARMPSALLVGPLVLSAIFVCPA